MQVDVSFSNAKVYNIERFDVVKGEHFSLNTDYTEPSRWFSDNDPVLSLAVNGNSAEVEAKEVGTSTILIMNEGNVIQKTLNIKVVDEIVPMAAELGANAGQPVDK